MPDIVIKPEDFEEMPEKTKELLLEYLLPKMGLHEAHGKWSTNEPKLYSSLSDQPPSYIPLEAAIAVLAPLKEQGLKAVSILLKDRKDMGLESGVKTDSNDGYSRAELGELLGISEKSVNGVIGSINRRFSFRLDKTKYDRKKCRVIRFSRKTGRYGFLNDHLKLTFFWALEALEEVKKDGLSHEKYDFTDIEFGKGEEFKGIPDRYLSQNAIDEFLREDNETHQLRWSWEEQYGDTAIIDHYVSEELLVGEHSSHLVFELWSENEIYLVCFECSVTVKDGGSKIVIRDGDIG
jgi:hypothetical protein